MKRLAVQGLGPLVQADVRFADLTVFVGPQASGKSILLQTLRLLLDKSYIVRVLNHHGLDWDNATAEFLNTYYGEGTSKLQSDACRIVEDDKPVSLKEVARTKVSRNPVRPRLFYVPAQRVLTLRNGWPRPFTDYTPGDPFAVREFSETLRLLLELEFPRTTKDQLFPQPQRITKALLDPLSEAIFHGFQLKIEKSQSQKRLVITGALKEGPTLPFMVWSAGQREFVPLLLGLYWLMPAGAVSRRDDLQWVVIEELEMGLHPRAISSLLLVVLELMRRGYRVCLSTHSPHVLEMVWALRRIKEHQGPSSKVLDLFHLNKEEPSLREVADEALKKTLHVYYFDREGTTHDISSLDPGSDDPIMADWGGLGEFGSRAADVVADVIANSKRRNGR